MAMHIDREKVAKYMIPLLIGRVDKPLVESDTRVSW